MTFGRRPDSKPIKVLIDARIEPGRHGGVETVVANLANVFRCELNHDISPIWLVSPRSKKWVESFIEKSWEIVVIDVERSPQRIFQRVINLLTRPKFLHPLVILLRRLGIKKFSIPIIKLNNQELGIDLVHFVTQDAFQTSLPSIYQPHDLQHEHFPDFFSRKEIDTRRRFYKLAIDQSTFTILSSHSAKNDFKAFYPEFSSKLGVVPQPANSVGSKSERSSINLAEQFGMYYLYPAAVWPHKNHSNLLAGFSQFLKKYPDRKLILCGPRTDSDAGLRRIIQNLSLENHVVLFGYVDSKQLNQLYHEARAVIIPSLFEAGSFPIWEAFSFEKLVAVSNIQSLKSQAQDGAIFFNPNISHDICRAFEEIEDLFLNVQENIYIQNSKRIYSKFSPCNTFLGFRYFYRRSLGIPIDASDERWLKSGETF